MEKINIFLILFLFEYVYSFNKILEYKNKKTNISCYDDLDCQNITMPIIKKNLINMDSIDPYSCVLNRCVSGYEFINKYTCLNSISDFTCSNMCNNKYKLIKTTINDCCQCFEVKDRSCNKNKQQCIDSNTDYSISNNFQYCENDVLRTPLFCVDNLYCHYKCFNIFGIGIYGYCDKNSCICYRKRVEVEKIQTENDCLSISKKKSNVNFVYINNICIFSKYLNSFNKCNYASCDTFCNYETGRCLIAI